MRLLEFCSHVCETAAALLANVVNVRVCHAAVVFFSTHFHAHHNFCGRRCDYRLLERGSILWYLK